MIAHLYLPGRSSCPMGGAHVASLNGGHSTCKDVTDGEGGSRPGKGIRRRKVEQKSANPSPKADEKPQE